MKIYLKCISVITSVFVYILFAIIGILISDGALLDPLFDSLYNSIKSKIKLRKNNKYKVG